MVGELATETERAGGVPASASTLDTRDSKERGVLSEYTGTGAATRESSATTAVSSQAGSTGTKTGSKTGSTGAGRTAVVAWLVSVPKHRTEEGREGREVPSRNYEAWRASNYMYMCGGRLRTALYCPQVVRRLRVPVLPLTVGLAVVPVVLCLVFEAAWFWHEVSPAVVVLFAYCAVQMLASVLKAALLDPGALPKNVHVTDGVEKDGLPPEYHSWIEMPGPQVLRPVVPPALAAPAGAPPPPPQRNTVYMKYCDSCYIWRPVRASHCSKCGVCVANMDHHCPWLGNCVGQRNYWYFFNFLAFAVATSVYLLAMSYYKVAHAGLHASRWSLFLGVYASCCLPYALLLLVFHVCLGLTGITTREYFGAERHEGNTQIQDVCLDPFNSGSSLFNLRRQWFHGRGRANVEIRGRYAANDLRYKELHVGTLLV